MISKHLRVAAFSSLFLMMMCSSSFALSGPKQTIMVGPFENKAGMGSDYAIGTALQDMLTEALQQSGQFIVTERPQIAAGLAEQDFAQSGRTSAIGRPEIGKITNAKYMVTGAVSEFDPGVSGTNAGLNIGGFGAGFSQSRAHVAVIIRIVDTTTMQVVDSQRVEGIAKATGASIAYQGGNVGGGLGGFRKTPVGEACQGAIDLAVQFIAGKLSSTTWQGAVAAVDQFGIIINIGGESGVRVGDRFNVLKNGQEIIDPSTGVSLGSRQALAGTIEIISVDPKFATARPISGAGFAPGDLIQPAN